MENNISKEMFSEETKKILRGLDELKRRLDQRQNYNNYNNNYPLQTEKSVS